MILKIRAYLLFQIYFFGFISLCKSQTINLITKCSLPFILTEASGLEVTNRNSFWSHNDSGGNNELYNFDSTSALRKTLAISNSANTDWEDSARDSAGNIFIGDFGNNDNDRKNLKIYKIPNPSSIGGNSVSAEVIKFIYPDQTAFPPSKPFRNFDVEAMLFFAIHFIYFRKTGLHHSLATPNCINFPLLLELMLQN